MFYTILSLTASHDANSGEARPPVTAMQQQRAIRAMHCPQRFGHKLAVIDAEPARRDGEVRRALQLYRAAIEGAEREGFLQDEAIAKWQRR